jgi:hypothetical protein
MVGTRRHRRFVGQPRAGRLAASLVGLLAAAIALQVVRDRAHPRNVAEESVLYVQSGEVMKRLALSYDPLLADVYWIRAIQHYGGTRRTASDDKRYHLLYPLLSITVALDPLFTIAYRFGAIFLSEPWPGGPGRTDQAIALLKKGLEVRPHYWRFMQDIGFVHYWWEHDYRAAAEWFERGADVPGAPWWMRSLAATTLAQGGDRQASRTLWQALAQVPDNEWLQRDARRRLQQLDALDLVDEVQAVVRDHASRTGRTPASWEELIRARALRRVPSDPTGTPLELDPSTGDVRVSPASPLQPLPSEPPHAPAAPPVAPPAPAGAASGPDPTRMLPPGTVP